MADYQFLALTDEKKFEDLINDLCCKKYTLEFQIYGRKGQKQYGIDGSALTKDNKHILHQCKNKMLSRDDVKTQKELLDDLEKETNSMVNEFIQGKGYIVEEFIFANSFKRDTKLQDKAIELSKKYKISITVWSWDEIVEMLEDNMDIARKYYSEFFRDTSIENSLSVDQSLIVNNDSSDISKSHIIYRDGYIEPRTVYIKELDIYVAVCPVTFEEYDLFWKENNHLVRPENSHFFKDIRGEYPVINVNWNDAYQYCLWLGDKLGESIRLPSLYEWEEIAKKNNNYFIKKNNSYIQKVGTIVGELDIFDMYGNIYQWCLDTIDYDYKAVRGSFFDDVSKDELTIRNLPNHPLPELGFRIVMEKDKIKKV